MPSIHPEVSKRGMPCPYVVHRASCTRARHALATIVSMKPATAGDENGFHLVPAREYARYAGHIITAEARNIQNFKVRVV